MLIKTANGTPQSDFAAFFCFCHLKKYVFPYENTKKSIFRASVFSRYTLNYFRHKPSNCFLLKQNKIKKTAPFLKKQLLFINSFDIITLALRRDTNDGGF